MALKIVDVKLTTNYDWQDVSNLASWQVVRNTNANWQQPLQTTTIGQLVKVEVEVSENNWLSIKEVHNTWKRVKERFSTWLDIKNY